MKEGTLVLPTRTSNYIYYIFGWKGKIGYGVHTSKKWPLYPVQGEAGTVLHTMI